MLDLAMDEGLLKAGEIYLNGETRASASEGPRLPATVLAGGWHRVELWGVWASRREARIELLTQLPSSARVFVALLMHAPPGSHDARCAVEIGGVKSEPKTLADASQWLFFEGETDRVGRVAVTLRADGVYGQPDARQLYVGLRGFAFCAASDAATRRRLMRKLRRGAARRALQVGLNALSTFRLRRGARPEAAGVTPPSPVESREPRPPSNAFPILDRPLSEAMLPNRLTANGSGDRRWLNSLDLSTHRPATDHDVRWEPHAAFVSIGWMVLDHRGRDEPLLTGVVAVRGRIVSERPLVQVKLKLGDEVLAIDKPTLVKRHVSDRLQYIVNIWIDCDRLKPCRTILALVAVDNRGEALSVSEAVNITRTPPSFEAKDSDAFVPSPAYAYYDLTSEILARPAVVRSAARSVFTGEIRRILAMRVDQLGDVSATLPALQRLRDVFPDAELTALVPSALVDIIKATGLFTEVLELTLTYNQVSEKRYLDEREEARFRKVIHDYAFDIAIDLCPAPETRPLLQMVDAKYLVGFHADEFPFLDFGIRPISRDKINQNAVLPHANFVMMLIEALALAAKPVHPPVKRVTDDGSLLRDLGLEAGEYVVIHTGARHKINCWPEQNFLELADRIAGELSRKVVFFSDVDVRRSVVEQLKAKDRILFPGRLPVDQFDALLSNGRLMIGNDSGPKHLAAVRGVDTVSIHVNRLNWREWGQSSQGVIISKPVPCCGCELNNELLCGKNVACVTSIKVDEVFDVVRGRLERAGLAKENGHAIFND